MRAAWATHRPAAASSPRSACAAPWVSLELDPAGWVYACCANQLYPLGRIGVDRLRDLWGGPRAQVLREALDRWDLSVGCGSCAWHLDHGRMDPDAAVYDGYPVTSEAPGGPVAMTFALSNRCNLACPMCTPELSSTLRRRAGLPPLATPYDDAFFADLAELLPGLVYAKFLGGEPFLVPEHHRVWDLMEEVGGPPRLQVTTNGTIWSDRVERLLDRFSVDVTVSIDAADPERYEGIRIGARFAEVRANLERFAAAARARGTELRICFCLMATNADQLAPVLELADAVGAEVSVNVVSDEGHALHDLPLAQLEAVRDLWARQGPRGPVDRAAEVWRTQVQQLDLVIEERHRGARPAARQAQQIDATLELLPPVEHEVETDAIDLEAAAEAERLRLVAWSGGGDVAELRGTAGHVADVVSIHRRLRIGPELVGSAVEDLGAQIERLDGRTAWLLGLDDASPRRRVRTLLLATGRPVRGGTGSVVRIVGLRTPTAWALLIAEDRIYDRPTTVPIEIGRHPASPRSAAEEAAQTTEGAADRAG